MIVGRQAFPFGMRPIFFQARSLEISGVYPSIPMFKKNASHVLGLTRVDQLHIPGKSFYEYKLLLSGWWPPPKQKNIHVWPNPHLFPGPFQDARSVVGWWGAVFALDLWILWCLEKVFKTFFQMVTYHGTPLKFNMEPENGTLEKEIPFGNHHFQVRV